MLLRLPPTTAVHPNRVRAKHWAGAIVARPDADALNNRLGLIVRRVNEKVNEFIDERRPINVEEIRQYIFDGSVAGLQQRETMTEWITKQVGQLQVGKGTRKHYELLCDRLGEFGRLKNWSDLTVENIYAWDTWLHRTVKAQVKRGEDERDASDGTVYNYHKHLKAMLHRAVDCGMINASPYDRLRGRFKRGDVENVKYLTDEQMKLVVDLHPVVGSQMEAVRDLFVFQMFTGLSFSDAQDFDISRYRKEGDSWVYTGQRIKTGVPYVSVLLPPVVDVLERHGWQVPKIANQKYNCLLKTMGSVIGIEGLHSHMARHTFATYMLSKDVKVQNVMRMLGHKKIQQTMRYAKVLAKDVRSDFERVAETMKL